MKPHDLDIFIDENENKHKDEDKNKGEEEDEKGVLAGSFRLCQLSTFCRLHFVLSGRRPWIF